jgi:hypothetical protein
VVHPYPVDAARLVLGLARASVQLVNPCPVDAAPPALVLAGAAVRPVNPCPADAAPPALVLAGAAVRPVNPCLADAARPALVLARAAVQLVNPCPPDAARRALVLAGAAVQPGARRDRTQPWWQARSLVSRPGRLSWPGSVLQYCHLTSQKRVALPFHPPSELWLRLPRPGILDCCWRLPWSFRGDSPATPALAG